MKKNHRLFLFIGIAVVLVFFMYLLGPSGTKDDKGGDGGEDPSEEFKKSCDSLRSSPWNSVQYSDLKSRLESLKSQEVITTTEALLLGDYLDLAYAKTMQQACADWESSDGNSANSNLFQAMEEIVKNPKCKALVSNEIDDLRCYFKALELPARVNGFISGKFNGAVYSQLINDLNRFCKRSGISHFSRLKEIKSTQENELNEFKVYADAYESKMNYYNSDTNDHQARNFMEELCPDNNASTKKYPYYKGDITTIPGLCLP